MKPPFTQTINRQNTGALKWEIHQDAIDPGKWIKTEACFEQDPLIPMWVADMDLPCPAPVLTALEKRAKHPIYGYTIPDDAYFSAVCSWMKKRHSWDIDPAWIVTAPGVVPALHVLVRAFTSPGQKVLVQQPVYYPFFSAVTGNHCEIVSNTLVLDNGRYMMDFEDLDRKTSDPDLTVAILCSPHNPVGRVWTREELETFGTICKKNNVLVISDEIHGDLVYPGVAFTPFGTLESELRGKSVICTAPSKTFNLAGLQTSNIVIQDPDLRARFQKQTKASGLAGTNPFGIEACKAAYNEGEPWLEDLLVFLKSNLDAFTRRFAEEIPHIPVIEPQGTYLVWFDCRNLNLGHLELRQLMLESARVILDEGYIFGPEGTGFERINIACPEPVLMAAADRIIAAVKSVSQGQ